MHQLDVTYHNTYNCKTLKIEDNSVYNDNIVVNNPILEIKPPGLFHYVPFYFANKNWKSITLNCSTLKTCCAKQPCKLTELLDGIYDIKYSIDPNIQSIIEFSHMRVCKLMSSYIKLVGLFFSNRHLNSKGDNECITEELISIKNIIDACVYAIEENLDNTTGLELYSEAATRLNKINDGNFTSCCK